MEYKKLLTQPAVFASSLAISDPSVFASLKRKLNAQNLSQYSNSYSRAIKFQLCRIVCWGNRFVGNGVTIYDRCLYAALEKDIQTRF